MKKCYSLLQNSDQLVMASFVCCLLATASSIFLLVVIRKTQSLLKFSRLLLFNEQIVCLLRQICAVIVHILELCLEGFLGNYFAVFNQILMTASLLLLLGISLNLHLAIYNISGYRELMNQRRGIVFIICSGVLSILVGCSPFFNSDMAANGCQFFSSLWLTVLYTILGIGSAAANAWFLGMIIVRARPNGSTSRLLHQRQKLAKFIFVLSICNSVVYIVYHITYFFRLPLLASRHNYVVYVAIFLSNLYSNLRICFNLLLYRPMWETTKTILGSCRRHTKVAPAISIATIKGSVPMPGTSRDI